MSPKDEAKARGDKFYLSGKPCLRGHVSERITRDGDCAECRQMRNSSPEYKKKSLARANANRQKPGGQERNAHWQRVHREKPGVRDKMAARTRERNYGVSPEQYEEMLLSQEGKCAITGMEETDRDKGGKIRKLAVDHCHATGKVRGLLSGRANKAIGLLNDNPVFLANAIAYIEKHRLMGQNNTTET